MGWHTKKREKSLKKEKERKNIINEQNIIKTSNNNNSAIQCSDLELNGHEIQVGMGDYL